MTAWRQAVFIRQRRLDVIQRALSKILDDESWSPATPRRLHVGAADASSHGWTMIVPQLADFFLDDGDGDGGAGVPRLARLAEELRCPAYAVDVRNPDSVTLIETDGRGLLRSSGAPRPRPIGETRAGAPVGFALIGMPDEAHARLAELAATRALRGSGEAVADYLGALVGFPAWTRHGDEPFAAGALSYEPPPIVARASSWLRARPETRAASVRTTPRAVPPSGDRRGTRPRSASRPRR